MIAGTGNRFNHPTKKEMVKNMPDLIRQVKELGYPVKDWEKTDWWKANYKHLRKTHSLLKWYLWLETILPKTKNI